mmetsp:Transcript_22055/g.30281  ORF Transcript_22055/g.30281 Transcript_22055/m.30281 type:complete len:94 (+) Transcript_22055:562-843(+)
MSNSDLLHDPLSDAASTLRFLVRCFPQGITASDEDEYTPYFELDDNNPKLDYARRLLLMYADKHDPTCILDRDELRRLNYEARKMALIIVRFL